MAHARIPSAPDASYLHALADSNRVLLVEKNGKLHHPFPRTIAPYPLSHERAVADADSLDLAFRLHLFDGSPSAIPLIRLDDPTTHPRRCLDLGCGSGEWIMAAAKLWPHTTFVGLDLVPPQLSLVDATSLSNKASLQSLNTASSSTRLGLHPTLGASTSSPVTSVLHRVEWVQANFLRTLPFYTGEFDYVRLSGIASGVPEDKWDSLLSELCRVLAVNGHLEIEEEDVIFPILPSPDPTPSSDPASRPPFETPAHANSSRTAISTKRSFRTSTSSSFCCIGDEDVDVEDEDDGLAVPEASLSPHTAQKDTSITLRSNASPSPSLRRLSLSANRFLAAAAPAPPPPIPSLSINTRVGPRAVSVAKEDSPILQRPVADFPFELPSESTATSKPVTTPGHGPSIPRRRTNDPAIPPGWDGPVEHSAPNSASGSQFPISSLTNKLARASRRPKTTSSTIASTIMSSMSQKASKSDSVRRPSSAGANRKQGNGSVDASLPSVPPIPMVFRNPSSTSTQPDSPTKRSWKHVFSSKPKVPRSTVSPTSYRVQPIPIPPLASLTQRANVKHDHQVLQTLFFGVFESRFINTSPTAILPSLLNTYFNGVSVTAPIDFPVPPLPSAHKEACRTEKRNITQREWGRCGLEISQSAGLSVMRSSGDLKNANSSKGLGLERSLHTRALLHPSTSGGKQLKKSRSSPALASLKRSSIDQHYPLARPFTAQSVSSNRSESPSLALSSATSSSASIPTPTSAVHQNPRVQSIPEYDTSSPVSVQSPYSPIARGKEEEEDAKFAIMGDGGCFPLASPTTPSTQTSAGVVLDSGASYSSAPSETDNKRSMDSDTISHVSGWERPSLDVLTCEEGVEEEALNGKDLRDFDYNAALELGVFAGVFGSDIAKERCDPRALRQERVYVRPRGTFAGHGMPIPSALLELDDLAMAVHLTRCWTNVVACKEAMWEELQRRADFVPEESTYGDMTRSNAHTMRRITLLDQVQWVGSEQRLPDRDKFDLLFLRFEDDMRHWASVGSEMRGKLSWVDPRFPQHGPIPHPPLRTKASLSVFNPARRPSETPSTQSTLVSTTSGGSIVTSGSSSTESPTLAFSPTTSGSIHSGHNLPPPPAGQVRYGWDDGRGPGREGIVIPGVDICRTMRIFTARKAADTRDPGGNAMKIMSVL